MPSQHAIVHDSPIHPAPSNTTPEARSRPFAFSNARRKKKPSRLAQAPQSDAASRRVKNIWSLAAALASSQSETAAAALEKKLATVLHEGEEMPDLRHLFALLERLTHKAGDDLEEAEQQRVRSRNRMHRAVHQRRQARDDLHTEIVRLRRTLVDLYGARSCRVHFGWGSRTPRGSEELFRLGHSLIRRFRDPERPLPRADVPGVVIDPQHWIDTLDPLVQRLEACLKEVHQRRNAADSHAGERLRALEAGDETYLAVAQTMEALFRLGGQHYLRERLRPKGRKRVRVKTSGQFVSLNEVVAGEKKARTLPGKLAGVLRWPKSPPEVLWRLAAVVGASGMA